MNTRTYIRQIKRMYTTCGSCQAIGSPGRAGAKWLSISEEYVLLFPPTPADGHLRTLPTL
jgi:hypothetical protein